jgi:hypothetical protein
MKIVGADALGLALPIEYARPHVGAPPLRPEAEARWKAIVARVEEEDRAEVARFAKRMAQPAILAADAGGRGTVALLVGRRFAGMPFDLSVDVEVRAGDRVVCEGTGRIGDWQSLEKSLARRLKRTSVPQARWALNNGVARDVFVGVGVIELRRCRADDVPEKAFIAIRGGEQIDLPVPFPREAFSAAAEHAVEEERLEEDQRRGDRAATESKWRKAFRDARERIAALEKKRRELTERVTAMPFDDRAREELAKAGEELPRARRQYEDLEREASHAAVPREWRQ